MDLVILLTASNSFVLPLRADFAGSEVEIGTTVFDGIGFEYSSTRIIAPFYRRFGGVEGCLCLDFVQTAAVHMLGWRASGPFQDNFDDPLVSVNPWLTAYGSTDLLESSTRDVDPELWGTAKEIGRPYHFTLSIIDLFDLHLLAQTCVVRSFDVEEGTSAQGMTLAARALGPFSGWEPSPAVRRPPFDCRVDIPNEHIVYFVDDVGLDPDVLWT